MRNVFLMIDGPWQTGRCKPKQIFDDDDVNSENFKASSTSHSRITSLSNAKAKAKVLTEIESEKKFCERDVDTRLPLTHYVTTSYLSRAQIDRTV